MQCPNDRAVAILTLNPEYIAKSYFPEKLFESVGLETVEDLIDDLDQALKASVIEAGLPVNA